MQVRSELAGFACRAACTPDADTLYTQCSHCGSLFRIDQRQLEAADGTVRCGLCRGVFDARRTLRSQLLEDETKETSTEQAAPAITPSDPFSSEQLHIFDSAKSAEPAPRHRRVPVPASLASITLLAALLLQVAYFERDTLGAHPMLRPLLEQMCAVTGCTVPLPRNPSAIRFLDRDVREHPERAGALLVNITLRSDTPYLQAYPSVQVELTGMGERPVARRRLQPQEYLDSSVDWSSGMPPHTPLQITVEFVAPQEPVFGFRLDLS